MRYLETTVCSSIIILARERYSHSVHVALQNSMLVCLIGPVRWPGYQVLLQGWRKDSKSVGGGGLRCL